MCLRSLCTGNAVGPSSVDVSDFIKILEQTRKDALFYVNIVLSQTAEMIRSIEEFFGYYLTLDMETWIKCLPNILEEVNSFQESCIEVLKIYKAMVFYLNERQQEVLQLISGYEDLNQGLEKRAQAKRKEAKTSFKWASILRLFLL